LDSVNFKVSTIYPIDEITLFIDPIDATKEFTEGLYSNVTILIGIAHKTNAIAGVVFQPWSLNDKNAEPGFLLWGLVGHGLEGNVQISTREPDINNLIVATTRSHWTSAILDGLEKLKPATTLRVGGCGYKSIIVIIGEADVYYYPSRGTNKWDTCAPEALLKCVGGTLTDIYGNPINYGRDQPVGHENGIIVSKRHHDEILNRLKIDARL